MHSLDKKYLLLLMLVLLVTERLRCDGCVGVELCLCKTDAKYAANRGWK